MKKLIAEDIINIALDTLEKYRKENMKHLAVGWVSQGLESELGKLGYIEVCEHEINTREDFDRWQERIEINTNEKVMYYDFENNKFRNIDDVIEDIKKSYLNISFCFRLIQKTDKGYLVKCLDKVYLLKTENIIFEFDYGRRYRWVCLIYKNSFYTYDEIYLLDDDETLALMI